MRHTRAFLAPMLLAAAATGFCQSQGFEVASIKPSDPAARGSRMGGNPAGGFNASNVTLKSLIQQAWEVRDFQVTGEPGWVSTDRFDLIAKGAGLGVTDDELNRMKEDQRNAFRAKILARLQLLLIDRFQLKIHKETKEMPIYGLVVAKNGPKLPVTAEPTEARSSINVSRDDKGRSDMTFRKSTVSSLVRILSDSVRRTVVNQTGLDGEYDFKLTFVSDLEPGADGPSVFTAVQDQLGLRLESQKGPVEVLVVDGVQKPSEN